MAPRAIWKGHLEIGQLLCPVALHAAASTSERVAFHIVNRKTGHRVRRVFVDAETGEPVDRDDQANGYETDRGKTIVVEEEELAEAVPESDKSLRVEAFIPCGEVDTLYFDRPYYLTPDGEAAETAFTVIRKNYLFVGSEAGGRAAAIAYTLIETAKLSGVDPHAWLADTLARIPDYTITKLDELLPWRWSR